MIKSLVDLRGSFGPARDQNPRPTCMAFAASDAHAGARSGWTPLSAEWAYYHAVKRESGLPHQGASLNAMLATQLLNAAKQASGEIANPTADRNFH